MEVRQNLPFASNACNPFVRAFDYLRRIIAIYRERKRKRERERERERERKKEREGELLLI